ncbi:DNA-packaging protein [Crassaminicella profunda]|uniref:DNA-packaging protein n=1 Tax=Crassaminicella profunda TaxID=1286698 RepID=UPI001CA65E55|nr:DNA-packaging protein [Crassaminicella profunda]QZY56698.1 DNA-packaging protein [Crassaminicella profunda]
MAKSKWDTYVKDKLLEVQAWARDGLTDEQIAHNLGIAVSTFYEYKKKHSEFSEALKKGKTVVDIEVENALLKRALGYKYNEVTQELKINSKTGEAELVVTKVITKEVQPDTTAEIFWLKNRKPAVWRDKVVQELEGEVKVNKKVTKNELKAILEDDEDE